MWRPWLFLLAALAAYTMGCVSLFLPGGPDLMAWALEMTAAVIGLMLCVTWRPSE